MNKEYNFQEREKHWQEFWEKEKIYKFDPERAKRAEGEIFSVDTPPPTVSGDMHMGHAFSYAQQDFVIRYMRMLGKNIFYPFGTDDNGLPTERLVERINKVKSKKMSRQEFIDLCLKTLEKIRPEFVNDWKKLGISCDFDIFYSTINDHCRKLSQKSFLDIYKDKRAYRKRSPFLWCPECQTAIAQVEMEDKEQESQFVYIKFDTSIGKPITFATTRPELLPACVAIHVHPDDKRYKKFIGAKAKVPFSDREVEIYANKDADPEFGSGAVYHCTFGDMDDVEWIKEFNIEPIEILNPDGTLNEKAGQFKGLKIIEARKAITEALGKEGRVEKAEPITHAVNVHERCGAEIEILMTDQWFIKYMDLKDEFIKKGQKIKWYPDFMRSRYENWIQGLKWDWCISRQRFFGVPFPVWYCRKCGEVKLAEVDQLPVDPLKDKPKGACKCGSDDFDPEKDVFDTWATSSLTPQLAIELVEDEEVRKKLFPMTLRPQAHDIVTFWLFNTVVKSYLHEGKEPWQTAMISGWALDKNGKKMSKSKGNVVKPQDIEDKYGVDALRFWAGGSSLGQDLRYNEEEVRAGKRTMIKIWNASRFVLSHLEDYKHDENFDAKKLQSEDKWLLHKLQKVLENYHKNFEKYEYSHAKEGLDAFFWHDLADNYLEIAKHRLYNPDQYGEESRQASQWTLYTVLLSVLKMYAPIMPYVTEEVYQFYFKENEDSKSIHLSRLPKVDEKLVDKKQAQEFEEIVEIIAAVRKYKTKQQISMKKELAKMTVESKDKNLEKYFDLLKAVMNIGEIEFGEGKVEINDKTKISIA